MNDLMSGKLLIDGKCADLARILGNRHLFAMKVVIRHWLWPWMHACFL